MTVNFDGYEVYSPGTSGLWRDLSRRDAKAAYTRLMEAKPERFRQLAALLEADGLELPPPERVTDEELDAIGSWFLANVAPEHEGSSRLLPEWYSVVTDLGLYVGDVMIARAENLRWDMFTGSRKTTSYQESVIMGFKNAHPKYFVNPGFMLADMAHNKLMGINAHGTLSEIVRYEVATDVEQY